MTVQEWLLDLRFGEVLEGLGALFSPFVALWFQRRIDRSRDRRAGQERIFKDLMSTRATPTSYVRVNALNMIDLEFYGGGSLERAVREAAEAHLASLNKPPEPHSLAVWDARTQETYIRLLKAMARFLRYEFSETHLERSVYYPNAHGTFSDEQERARKAMLNLLEGRSAIAVQAFLADVPQAPMATPPADDKTGIALPESSEKKEVQPPVPKRTTTSG
jgi:hypothetical protein